MKLIDKDALILEIERKMEERDNSRDEAIWNSELWSETEYSYRSREDEVIIDLINTLEVKEVDEPTAADRGMIEEIVICLKRVEQDYCIDLTKEMKWLRNKAQKGEKVC